jgi:hypothetical protein
MVLAPGAIISLSIKERVGSKYHIGVKVTDSKNTLAYHGTTLKSFAEQAPEVSLRVSSNLLNSMKQKI